MNRQKKWLGEVAASAEPVFSRKESRMNSTTHTTTAAHDPSPALYKALAITLSDETQVYVVEAHVDERHVRGGDEAGVICHMVDASKADLMVAFLNRRGAQ